MIKKILTIAIALLQISSTCIKMDELIHSNKYSKEKELINDCKTHYSRTTNVPAGTDGYYYDLKKQVNLGYKEVSVGCKVIKRKVRD